MAGKTATLVVKIIGDSTGATAAISSVESATASVTGITAKGGAKMAGVWTGVAAAITASAKAASNLEQATGAVTAIFGDQADEIMTWAESMEQYGLSTSQAAASVHPHTRQTASKTFSWRNFTAVPSWTCSWGKRKTFQPRAAAALYFSQSSMNPWPLVCRPAEKCIRWHE